MAPGLQMGAVHCGAVSNRRKGNHRMALQWAWWVSGGCVLQGNAGDMQNTKKRQSDQELCESEEMSAKAQCQVKKVS